MQAIHLASVAHDAASKAFCKPDGQDDSEALRGLRHPETAILCGAVDATAGVWRALTRGFAPRGAPRLTRILPRPPGSRHVSDSVDTCRPTA